MSSEGWLFARRYLKRGDVASLEGTQLHFVFALPVQILLASAVAVQGVMAESVGMSH